MAIAIVAFTFLIGMTVGIKIKSNDCIEQEPEEQEMMEMDLALPPPTFTPHRET